MRSQIAKALQMSNISRFIGFLITTLALSACTAVGNEPTPVVAPHNSQQAQVPVEATSTPPPLRFDLPTPGSEPVSGWRPPLYPVPWAVSPYDHFYFARPIGADNVNWPLAQYRYGGIFFENVQLNAVKIEGVEGIIYHQTGYFAPISFLPVG